MVIPANGRLASGPVQLLHHAPNLRHNVLRRVDKNRSQLVVRAVLHVKHAQHVHEPVERVARQGLHGDNRGLH